MTARLDALLLEAHARGDSLALMNLYAKAADGAKTEEAQAFFLTHAYVFALESGSDLAPSLRQRLIDMKRESPLQPNVS
ncbi:MAG: hypothetical protein AAF636_06420 [Pseudomonadota bacterium]